MDVGRVSRAIGRPALAFSSHASVVEWMRTVGAARCVRMEVEPPNTIAPLIQSAAIREDDDGYLRLPVLPPVDHEGRR
jgi:hypothetical protein